MWQEICMTYDKLRDRGSVGVDYDCCRNEKEVLLSRAA